jgi:hypothetical protein
MIYLSNASDIIPGKVAEYDGIVAKEMLPIMAKLGINLVGAWHSYTGNANQIYALYSYKDLAELQKVREAQEKDKDYQRVNVKLSALRTRLTRTIFETASWSPMK